MVWNLNGNMSALTYQYIMYSHTFGKNYPGHNPNMLFQGAIAHFIKNKLLDLFSKKGTKFIIVKNEQGHFFSLKIKCHSSFESLSHDNYNDQDYYGDNSNDNNDYNYNFGVNGSIF